MARDHAARTLSRWCAVGGGRRDLSSHLLAAAAFAVATVVLLLTLGVNAGMTHRIDRAAWTNPAASDRAVAVQTTTTRYLNGDPVTIVYLAPTATSTTNLNRRDLPAPPGLQSFPRPGATWLSPTLAERVRDTAGHSGFAAPAGEVGRAGLTGPDQLLAIVGQAPGSAVTSAPAVRDQMRPTDYVGPVEIESFDGADLGEDAEPAQYRWLVLIASVLLTIPALSLAGAAPRLTSSRRQHRLAALRLAGAPRRTIVLVTLYEVGVVAGLGTLVGTVGYGVLLPVAARAPLLGTRWYTTDLWVGSGALVAAVFVVAVVAAASSLTPTRQILKDPIAVADRSTPALPHWWRLLAVIGVVLGFLWLTKRDDAGGASVLLALAALFAVLDVLGPFALGLVGRVMARFAQDGARLIAARRLLDDPRGAWRQVSALALAAFIAGFLALFAVGGGQLTRGSADTLEVAVSATTSTRTAAEFRDRLVEAGLPARVTVTGSADSAFFALSVDGSGLQVIDVRLPGDAHQAARTRMVIAKAAPANPQATGFDLEERDAQYGRDFRLATILILAVSFGIAVVSTAITAAASVLDRRQTYQRLWQAGVPLALLDRARSKHVSVPVVLATVVSAGAGLFAAAPLTLAGAKVEASGVLLLVGSVGFGLVATWAGTRASRPLLARVSKAP